MNTKYLKFFVVFLFFLLYASLSEAQFSKSESTIDLRSGKLTLSPNTTSETLKSLKAARADGIHVVVKTHRNLTVEQRKSLEKKGVIIIRPISHSTYIAKLTKMFNPEDKFNKEMIFNIGQFKREQKIAPQILEKEKTEKAYMIKPKDGAAYNYVVNTDGTLNLTVQFYSDVSEKLMREIMSRYAKKYEKMSDTFWSVTVDRDALLRLADEDAVQWVDAGPIPFLPENDRTRRIINVDPVQNFNTATGVPQGLGGQGVDIGIFDSGVDQNHNDFTGRTLVTHASDSSHGTHVTGIALGDGRMSNQNDNWGNPNVGTAFQWRGMSPQADLIEAPSAHSRNAANLLTYVSTNGMDISNHSYSLSFDGVYDAGNVFIDQSIHGTQTSGGTTIPARLEVFSAGNHGTSPSNGGNQIGYFSLTKQMKNALIVGNYDVPGNSIARGSSLGPTCDGRIKPDVVAPGSSIISAGYCAACPNPATGTAQMRTNYYQPMGGTSMASPAVTGTLGLVLQQWAATFNVNLDTAPPLPSTLRAIIVHTACDISGPIWFDNEDAPVETFPGPDFVTGWGVVDASAAVDAVTRRRVIEDNLPNTCDKKEYTFYVGKMNNNQVKATLAWDDVPAVANAAGSTAPLLINDLDLELVDPNGTVHYPWLLNQRVVDQWGNNLSNSSQRCGTAVTVQTHLQPTLTPVYISQNNPNNVNDPIQPGDLRPAVLGKDHLNNIEVVQAQPVQGTWKAIVRGFNIAQGPQTFSLILPQSDLIGPIDICKLFPKLCHIVTPKDLCKKYPKLCEWQIVIPGKTGPVIQFRDNIDRVVIQLDRICQYVLDCPGCSRIGYCPGYDVRLPNMPDGFKIEVYDSDGRQLYKDMSDSKSKQFKFKSEKNKSYFMVVRPGRKTQLNKEYTLPMQIKSF